MATVEARPTDTSREWRTLVNRHTGEQLEIRRAVRDGAPCLELKGLLPPRQEGPPLHIHYQTHEEFNVTAGTLSVEVDGRPHRFEAGSTALLPAGSAHRWWNAGDEILVLEGRAWPVVDLDVYFAAAFEVLNSGPANRPPCSLARSSAAIEARSGPGVRRGFRRRRSLPSLENGGSRVRLRASPDSVDCREGD